MHTLLPDKSCCIVEKTVINYCLWNMGSLPNYPFSEYILLNGFFYKDKILKYSCHRHGTKKNLSPQWELNPLPPKHRAGALCAREFMVSAQGHLLGTRLFFVLHCTCLPSISNVLVHFLDPLRVGGKIILGLDMEVHFLPTTPEACQYSSICIKFITVP